MKIQNSLLVRFLFGCFLGLGATLVSKTVSVLFNNQPFAFEFSWAYVAGVLFGGIAFAIYTNRKTTTNT